MNDSLVRALVTGGSGGIGAAICKQLAAAGHFVYVHANRGQSAAETVVGDIIAGGGQARAVSFDVTDAAATNSTLVQLLEISPIQILVNNAGIHDDAVFPGMRAEQWHRVIDVALDGFYNVTQPLMMPMIRTRWGRIINISSVTALAGNRGQVNYAAAKGALNAATKALSLEVASRGITVNAVAPGIIAAGMGRSALGGAGVGTAGVGTAGAGAPPFDAATIANLVPMKRAGTAAEVASLVGFLASREAGYITGQVISINGGMI
jgi:3-oxoacyl-[acyl-carrier protein] reductase